MDCDTVLVAPSNPWLSVDPLLAIPQIRKALESTKAPVIAVSPLVEGKAVKGPTAKLMDELGLEVTNHSIAAHYGNLLDGLVVHNKDEAPQSVAIARTDTLMKSPKDRERVARTVLALAAECRR